MNLQITLFLSAVLYASSVKGFCYRTQPEEEVVGVVSPYYHRDLPYDTHGRSSKILSAARSVEKSVAVPREAAQYEYYVNAPRLVEREVIQETRGVADSAEKNVAVPRETYYLHAPRIVEREVIQETRGVTGSVEKNVAVQREAYYLPAPRLVEREVIQETRVPSKKTVNVQVDVQREPGYSIVRRDSYKPRRVIVNEKVKLPSYAVKERETIHLGGEHERSEQIVPARETPLIAKVDLR